MKVICIKNYPLACFECISVNPNTGLLELKMMLVISLQKEGGLFPVYFKFLSDIRNEKLEELGI